MASTPIPGLKVVTGISTDGGDGSPPPPPHADTAAGIATHPSTLEPLREVLTDPAGDEYARSAFTSAVGALETVSESVSAMVAARRECTSTDVRTKHIGVDGQVTLGVDPAVVGDLITALNTSFSQGAARIDVAMKAIDQAESSLGQKIQAAITDPHRNEASRVALAQEVRGFLKSMPVGERIGWVMSRIREGDRDVMFATCAGGSLAAYASGLTPEWQARLLLEAADKFAPAERASMKGLATLREHLTEASARYYASYTKNIPHQAPAVAKSRDALKRLKTGAA